MYLTPGRFKAIAENLPSSQIRKFQLTTRSYWRCVVDCHNLLNAIARAGVN